MLAKVPSTASAGLLEVSYVLQLEVELKQTASHHVAACPCMSLHWPASRQQTAIRRDYIQRTQHP